ncbi:MAG TPA: signal peptidase I [Patescibacteria group bacterium]|nr:signal peptidase I [Patescibacteria group bacterium]
MVFFRKVYSFLIDTLQSLLIAAAVFLVIYQFLFRPFQVKGDSMYPNFFNDSYVLTNIIGLKMQAPKLGDVIVFKAPPDPEKAFIKRVIGTSGNTIMIQNGQVFLNDKPLDESAYLKTSVRTYGGSFLREGTKITIPDNEFFVMGDNRTFSSDSREWGFVKKDLITGYSFFVYWPVNEAKIVKNPYTN